MFEAVASPYLVKDDGKFRIKKAVTAPPEDAADKKKCKKHPRDNTSKKKTTNRLLSYYPINNK